MTVTADIDRFEVTIHHELAERGAFVIGHVLDGVIRPGTCVDTNLDPPILRVAGIEFLDNISEKKYSNALIFAERPSLEWGGVFCSREAKSRKGPFGKSRTTMRIVLHDVTDVTHILVPRK